MLPKRRAVKAMFYDSLLLTRGRANSDEAVGREMETVPPGSIVYANDAPVKSTCVQRVRGGTATEDEKH